MAIGAKLHLFKVFRLSSYLCVCVLTIGGLLSLVGLSTPCQGDTTAELPGFCALAGVGTFIVFVYFVTLLPALLAMVGAVLLVDEAVRAGLRIATRR